MNEPTALPTPSVVQWSPACGVILAEWRDEFSLQDLTGDGTITLEESQETAFCGAIATGNVPLNYDSPRQIRFGAEIRF